ncbi:hypothetical protein C1H46_023582 [Malus baccata]|uniref:Uncharacterized protein n=1 Tax=Malus baccata TaxID=106549 RepID=A0A540LX06_MALBA|nr:hypothetical protein C1H46_023582 [Malus baccata]
MCRIYNKKGTVEKQQPQQQEKEQQTRIHNVSTSSEFEDGKPPATVVPIRPPNNYVYFDTSKSVPKLHTDSSCSEHVVSSRFTCEVQSKPKWKEWEKALEFLYNHTDATMENRFRA